MSKMKRSFLTGILTVIATICLFGAGMFTVNAETSAFVMTDGAAVRFDETNSGIRFTAKIGEQPDSESSYHMMIIPEEYVAAYNLQEDYYNELVAALTAAGKDPYIATMECEPFQADAAINPSLENGAYYIQGSLVNLKYYNVNRKFFAIAYAVNAAGEYTYASFTEGENVRSIVNVASAALNSGTYDTAQEAVLTKYITQGANYVNGVPEENKDAAVDLFFAVEENVMMEEGQSQSFAVRGIPAGLDLAMEWSVSDDAVLSVDEAGTVTALAIGNAEVYVKILGETYTSTVRVVAATPENVLFSAAYEGTRGNLSQSSGLFEDYIAAADVPEIKGDYDGTAARFTEGQSSRTYLLSLGHVSVEELAEYDYVSLWFAFQCNTEAESDAATYMAVLGDTNNLVGNYYQANTNLPKNTWVQLYIPIDQLIELRQADETVVLFDFWSEKGSSTMMKFCIGDIVLEKAADDILFSAGDPFTSGNIGIDAGNGISKGETYADASQIEGIAGEYTGAALQFVSDGGAGTKAYYLDIGKTAEELREYSYVKLTFAATPADQTGVTHGCSMGTDSLLGYFKKDSGNIWNLPKNQWIEEQIPVETLIEFMNGESRIKIFALYGENMNQLPSLPSFYIGDIVLIK